LGGNEFQIFGKNAKANLSFWEDLVEPFYEEGMKIETWMNGRESNKMPTYCTPEYSYDSINVRELVLDDFGWGETQDHSKYGICISSPIVCFADINRQFSQSGRGGGAVCLKNSALWGSFNSMINSTDSC